MTTHIGEAHTVNVDPKRPHIAYVSSSDRVGAYEFDIPASLVEPGGRRLDLVADFARPMADAGDAFPEIPRDEPAAYRFWYARVTPR